MSEQLLLVMSLVLAYGLGSIPFGLLFTRWAGQGDIRDIGSGNIGATNVLRTGNKLVALLTLLADAAKGFVAVMIAWRLVGDNAAAMAALASLIGHIFPVWLTFKGGKGVAVFIGTMLMLSPLAGLNFLLLWIVVAIIGRRSSLAAIIAFLATPALLYVLGEMVTMQVSLVMVAISLWAHKENISRLLSGTEPKIGQ
ncbi:MAG: glycerol-3-phosphate 1-O-acyltransferase PlsY [Parvibaculales bacterium]